ncbi:MAG: NADP-dependent oxidoreductase [Fibrobacteres bacterium]|jgi:NADPH:quinone reductase-like Zn-dependent oxidoreductase|nr:NADP-dependent oxidoreductase [Fibrobacterota bacterium]
MSTQSQNQTETLNPAGQTTMKAVRIHAFGGPEVMRYEDAPRPQPKSGEVLIKVKASSANPADYKMASGLFGQLPLPATLGFDFSGTVEDLGPGVTKWKVGDDVFGTALGSLAGYRVSPQGELAAKPAGLEHAKAVTLPVAAQTAWKALFDTAQLKAGQKVLIQGGAGGVGGFAIQLAKDKGIFVAATASGRNQAYLKRLGADLAIDYGQTRFEDVARDFDAVFDTVGGEVQSRSFRSLRKGGILVSIVQPPSQEEAAKYGVKAEMIRNSMNPEALEYMAGLAAAGKLQIEIAATFPLAETAKAMEILKAGHTRGKIVILVG